jgi:hypothetical protein
MSTVVVRDWGSDTANLAEIGQIMCPFLSTHRCLE